MAVGSDMLASGGRSIGAVVSTVLLVVGALVSLGLKRYVRVRSRYYADSFFGAVLEFDAAEHKDIRVHKTGRRPGSPQPRSDRTNRSRSKSGRGSSSAKPPSSDSPTS